MGGQGVFGMGVARGKVVRKKFVVFLGVLVHLGWLSLWLAINFFFVILGGFGKIVCISVSLK